MYMGELNKNFQPMKGASMTRLCKKYEKSELDDVTRNP